MEYTVKTLAKFSGITVRTLHHYDKIGLLHPNRKNESGYRIYTDVEVDKLQQILFFRELDFGLDEIKNIIDSPTYSRADVLKMHRILLDKEKSRLETLIQTLDQCIEEEGGGHIMNTTDKFKGLDKSELEAYREEAKEKWGVEVIEASERRMKENGISGHEELQKQLETILVPMGQLLIEDVKNESVQVLVSKLRAYMNQFYDCTDEVFLGLADMYINDERFYENISQYGKGLPEFLAKAITYSVENKS